jgi:hypothetical protein
MSPKFFIGVVSMQQGSSTTVEIFTGWWDGEDAARGGFIKAACEMHPGALMHSYKIHDATADVRLPNV